MATFSSPSSFPPLFCCDHHKPLGFPISYHFRHIQRRSHHHCSKTSIQLSPTTPLGVTRFRCFSSQGQQQPSEEKPRLEEDSEDFEFERLFSNLNRATLKREPGSVTSSVLLVAGTTVGAGILAIPAVTQEAGFLAAAITCILCWIYMVVTGLLVAEVNVKTMCELGSGGINGYENTWDYWSSDYLMGMCIPVFFYLRQHLLLWKVRLIGAVNGVLVSAIIISFAALV
ncbi:Tryptophan/tyrosine permease, partial [Cynara cardunculus var. scolymus]